MCVVSVYILSYDTPPSQITQGTLHVIHPMLKYTCQYFMRYTSTYIHLICHYIRHEATLHVNMVSNCNYIYIYKYLKLCIYIIIMNLCISYSCIELDLTTFVLM